MTKWLLAMAAVAALAVPPVASAQEQQQRQADVRQADVPVRVVVLYSSGVGYFEHAGTVNGEATAELRFKTEQINDILKSLLLEDTGNGQIGTVAYPSHDPVERTLRSFQVDITGNPSLAELLNQLRGARVSLQWGAEQVSGIILGLEKQPKAVGETSIEIWVINLLTDGAIRAIELNEIRRIELEEEQLQQELNRALAALAQARDQDKKPVTIEFRGEGERLVRIGYVVETPVWKTSYRLILGNDEQPTRLQGWAIVENQTDNDWSNVQLSLVSGRPISFIQELYEPLYIQRPVVEPELWAGLRPQQYGAGMQQMERLEADAAPRPEAARMLREAPAARTRAGIEDARAPIDPARSIAAAASAAQLGELFQYTIPNVSLQRQRSAMIPIVTDEVEIERLSIYNRQVQENHPLTGARLTNTTDKHLLQGPVTVLDGAAYAGDAQIDNLPPGQQRLISFGIDLDVIVDPTKVEQETRILTGRITRGVLHLTRRHVAVQQYLAENKSERGKTLVIEHPLRRGWELVDSPEPFESTENLHRFRHELPAGQKREFNVTEQRTIGETFAILPADVGQILIYARTGEIPREVRDALAEAARRKEAMVAIQRQMEQRRTRVAEITAGQERIRRNMQTVDRNSEYYTRLLRQLNEEETEIQQLQTDLRELQEQHDQRQKELEDYLSNLNVG
jgi:hypothetical protein